MGRPQARPSSPHPSQRSLLARAASRARTHRPSSPKFLCLNAKRHRVGTPPRAQLEIQRERRCAMQGLVVGVPALRYDLVRTVVLTRESDRHLAGRTTSSLQECASGHAGERCLGRRKKWTGVYAQAPMHPRSHSFTCMLKSTHGHKLFSTPRPHAHRPPQHSDPHALGPSKRARAGTHTHKSHTFHQCARMHPHPRARCPATTCTWPTWPRPSASTFPAPRSAGPARRPSTRSWSSLRAPPSCPASSSPSTSRTEGLCTPLRAPSSRRPGSYVL